MISDASDDGTDEIVAELRGARRPPVPPAGAAGQDGRARTARCRLSRGDIVVFSDANAMYEPDALRKLVRNFADPDVGCVTGEARYLTGGTQRRRRRRARRTGTTRSRSSGSRRRSARWSAATARSTRSAVAVARAAGRRHQRLPEPAADRRRRLARRLRAGGDLLRGNGRRRRARVPAPRPHRQPQLARGLPGARRAQPVPRRPVRLVARLAQGAALALGRLCPLVAAVAGLVGFRLALRADSTRWRWRS